MPKPRRAFEREAKRAEEVFARWLRRVHRHGSDLLRAPLTDEQLDAIARQLGESEDAVDDADELRGSAEAPRTTSP